MIFIASLFATPNQYGDLRFRTFSPKGGFYYDGVMDINQDKDGFIWIMLDKEILRFDGYEYIKYLPKFENLDLSKEISFTEFAKDNSGDLFLLANDAIYKYDILKDSLFLNLDAKLSNFGIDSTNNFWGVKDRVLNRIDINNGKFTECSHNNTPLLDIYSYCFTGKNLFFASRNQIFFSDYDNPFRFTLLHTFPTNFSIIKILEADDYLWVLTDRQGVFQIDTSSGEINCHFIFQNKQDGTLAKTFLIDKNGLLWIGTQSGLYIINPESGDSTHYLHSKYEPFSLTNNSIWTLFNDDKGNIWSGHYAGGLCFIDLDDNFQIKTFTSAMPFLNYKIVSSFAEDGDLIFIGMDGGGVIYLDKKTGLIFPLIQQTGVENNSGLNHVKSLVVDSQHRLWTAMYRGGLECYNLNTRKSTNFSQHQNDSNGLLYNDLRKIVLDKNNGLWIAYQNINPVISHLSFSDNKFQHFNLGNGKSGHIFDIQTDKDGNLYVVTRQELYRITSPDKKIESLSGINFAGGQSLASDSTSNIYIGTISHGLLKYSPSNDQLTTLPDSLSRLASAIYSISYDNKNDCLWIGTDNGLVSYNIKTNESQRFDESDGFQGQVYYPLSAFRSSNGIMFFGGTNGFSFFEPRSISMNAKTPHARISEFYIDNTPVPSSFWKASPQVELNHDQANFGFKFSSDNYNTPEKNYFKYRLKGYDDKWITTDASNRMVMYSKVPPGNYQFEVLTANNDGVWSDVPTTIKIIRHPAPWASPLAYFIYFILFVIAVVIIYHYWDEKRKLKMKVLLDEIDKSKKEELHKSQLQFFTNISHDFRTPISLILASIDNMKQAGTDNYYCNILRNNSHRLLNLVNELMDFRTLDNKMMRLSVEAIDANSFVKNIASDFSEFSIKRNIKFTINCCGENTENLYIDKQVVEKVVLNLLNNAFKYTAENGEISIETYTDLSNFSPRFTHHHKISSEGKFDKKFIIAVRDTGCGISPDSIKDVFERYYQVNTTNLNQHLGTGIGLALVKSLILLHHGNITIYSERNKGTDIIVELPSDKAIYNEEDFATDRKSDLSDPINMIAYTSDTAISSDNALSRTKPVSGSEADYGNSSDRKLILLVEDNRDLRSLIAGFLKLHFDIIEASDGMEALKILDEKNIDLIISDIMMPNMDGIALCREIKNNINTSHIFVMLLTARTGIENRMEGADAGADIYFSKPVDLNLLLQSVRNIFIHQDNLRQHYSRNYYTDKGGLTTNRLDQEFLDKLTSIIDSHLIGDNIDVNFLADEMCMSRSKLYAKIKALTGKSIVEFILHYRIKKAACLIVEENIPLYQVMEKIGIRSQSYFVNAFKKEFGETPSSFMSRHRRNG